MQNYTMEKVSQEFRSYKNHRILNRGLFTTFFVLIFDIFHVFVYIIDHLIQKSSEISLVSAFLDNKIILLDMHFNCEVKVYV